MKQISLSKFLGGLAGDAPFSFKHVRRFFNLTGRDSEESVYCHTNEGYVYTLNGEDYLITGEFVRMPSMINIHEYVRTNVTSRDDFYELSTEEFDRIQLLESIPCS